MRYEASKSGVDFWDTRYLETVFSAFIVGQSVKDKKKKKNLHRYLSFVLTRISHTFSHPMEIAGLSTVDTITMATRCQFGPWINQDLRTG